MEKCLTFKCLPNQSGRKSTVMIGVMWDWVLQRKHSQLWLSVWWCPRSRWVGTCISQSVSPERSSPGGGAKQCQSISNMVTQDMTQIEATVVYIRPRAVTRNLYNYSGYTCIIMVWPAFANFLNAFKEITIGHHRKEGHQHAVIREYL